MEEFFESLFHAAGHGAEQCPAEVVPFEANTNVLLGLPVDRELVILTESCLEVQRVFLALVLDAEVIDDEGETDVTCFVDKETVGECLVVTVVREAFAEVIVSDLAGLFESIPRSPDFNVAVTVTVNNIVEIVVFDDPWGDLAEFEFYVLFSTFREE